MAGLTRNQTRMIVGAVVLLIALYVLATLVRWVIVAGVLVLLAGAVWWWLRRSFGGGAPRPPAP
jgi:uncharacterized membrane protein YdfJ with MMPL/SSD domain